MNRVVPTPMRSTCTNSRYELRFVVPVKRNAFLLMFLPLWLTVLCIGRDVAIALGALVVVLLRGKRTFPPSLAGKASTICQVLLIYGVLYLNAAGRAPAFLAWIFVLTALLTAGSFVQYVFVGLKMLRSGHPA